MIVEKHEIATPVMSQNLSLAVKKRTKFLDSGTDAIRLVDGDGDGVPGIFIDAYADRWVVATRSRHLPPDVKAWLESEGERGRSVYWKQLDQHEKESPTHLAGPEQDGVFFAKESGVRYRIDFQAGYSQGIFLDQRLNRQRVRKFSAPGKTVLNTFAYTGAFSVCAALGGAVTTTLDLSQVYLDWAKENFKANDLDPADHYFCKGDTFHWLKRFAKQGRTFDGIILDPPTFSRDDKKKVFRVEKDYHRLVALAFDCLAPGGWMLCCTNCRKLDPRDFVKMVRRGAPGSQVVAQPMPPEYTGENYLKSLWVTKG